MLISDCLHPSKESFIYSAVVLLFRRKLKMKEGFAATQPNPDSGKANTVPPLPGKGGKRQVTET